MKNKTLIVLVIVFILGLASLFFSLEYFGQSKIKENKITKNEKGVLPISPEHDKNEILEPSKTLQALKTPEIKIQKTPTPTPTLTPISTTSTIPKAPPVSPSTPDLFSWQKEAGIKVREAVSSSTLFINNQYWMYYTAIGGIFLARSTDGLNFKEYGQVLVNGQFGYEPETATNPSVFQLKNEKYRMIYEGNTNQQSARKLYSAISEDGLRWMPENGIRLEDSAIEVKGGINQEVVFTSVPDSIELENGCRRMYYTVINESRIAESCDDGLTWQKKGKIMFDVYPKVVQDPDIIKLDDGKYKLFFSTQDVEKTKQWILSASSADGINFKTDAGERIEPASGKARAVDPDVVRLPDGNYRMYYGESFTFEGDFDIFSALSER